MARFESGGLNLTPIIDVPRVGGTFVAPAGYMGEFGNGLWRVFMTAGMYQFVIPDGVTQIRARVVGAGGGGQDGLNCSGGGGGGYAHGIFSVSAGASYSVIVGQGGGNPLAAGGASSFGALLSATGGGAPSTNGSSFVLGGVGSGGDFQANGGGAGGDYYTGGGGAGSQLGDGGSAGADRQTGGGGIVGGSEGYTTNSGQTCGGSPFGVGTSSHGGADITGFRARINQSGSLNPISAVIRFPFDGFTGGGGGTSSSNSTYYNGGIGGGGGGGDRGGDGGVGGGGGGGIGTKGGDGGIGGGGGGNGSSGDAGIGGNGLVIVEW